MEQRQSIEDACAREGFELLDTLHELDTSGGAAPDAGPRRSSAIAAVETEQVDVIVAAFFDRLVRTLPVQREIVERVEKTGGAILAEACRATFSTSGDAVGALAAAHGVQEREPLEVV